METENAVKRFYKTVGARWAKIAPTLRKFVWVIPPIIVFAAMFLFFRADDLYPFGPKMMAWCDMDQQVVPLLIDFKDILSGKEGFFLSFKNAGGMNFYAVFFFFLCSPFSFLVAFVDKADVGVFMNVIITLKMCTISITASIYLYRKCPRAWLLNIALSVLYAFSGYVMMYYQNVMWLDVVYLFPLLLIGLDKLKEGNRVFFTLALSATVIVNFYLSYMIALFLLLYAFLQTVLQKDKRFAGNFILCCTMAVLLTAVVWIPSFLQYFSSGRRTSVIDSLKGSNALASYQTTVPTILSVAFLLPFAFCRKLNDEQTTLMRILLIATLLPVVLEPINKIWQTGNYMSFPTRYAFMTIFLCISLAFDGLTKGEEAQKDRGDAPVSLPSKRRMIIKGTTMYALNALFVALAVWYMVFAIEYTQDNRTVMDQYAGTLWGNNASFEAILKLYAVAMVLGAVLYVAYRTHILKPMAVWLSVAVMAFSELYVAPVTYVRNPSHDAVWQKQVLELADKIEDDGFYRVKTDKGYSSHDFDVNLMGSLGYNSLGHYTSLNAKNYMTAIKQFGYTSYWMETGNSGGTLLSDALLSIKYSISHTKSTTDIYQGEYFHISPTKTYLPLGILAQTDLVEAQDTADYSYRAQFQDRLAQDFFGENDVTSVYTVENAQLANLQVSETNGKYRLSPTASTGKLVFNLQLTEKSQVYFNAFDENNNALKQAINEKFTITVNGKTHSGYPKQRENGLLDLGEFNAGTTTVTVSVNSAVTVRDLSLLSIKTGKLNTALSKVQTIGLTAGKNSLSGSYAAEGGECVFLSIPYESGLSLKINGKKAKLYEVYDGFTAFYLKEGKNQIEITFTPDGFVAGAVITLLGLGLCVTALVLWRRKKWSLQLSEKWQTVAYILMIAVGLATVVILYPVPLILSAM